MLIRELTVPHTSRVEITSAAITSPHTSATMLLALNGQRSLACFLPLSSFALAVARRDARTPTRKKRRAASSGEREAKAREAVGHSSMATEIRPTRETHAKRNHSADRMRMRRPSQIQADMTGRLIHYRQTRGSMPLFVVVQGCRTRNR